MSSTATSLQGETDAAVWARAFAETIAEHPGIPTDQETMLGWFANAIMAGHDWERRKHYEHERQLTNARILLAEMSAKLSQSLHALDPESPTCKGLIDFVEHVMIPGLIDVAAEQPVLPADAMSYFAHLSELGITVVIDQPIP